ncbi:MAG: type II toxin-antitoxin system RelE/ParE family toxin [Halobacteriovoraceae bacterium]|nr:type II toxin-antitoxin system RelE/ParE family toxin [Halobacteriovoraceae bacterium]
MLKKVSWLGDSLDKLKEFPDEIKQNLGYELHRLQTGERPLDSKPMKSINQGVYELRDRDKSSWYRVIYYVKIKDSIYVLHSFEKKSNKTPQKDIALAQSRLKELKKELGIQ